MSHGRDPHPQPPGEYVCPRPDPRLLLPSEDVAFKFYDGELPFGLPCWVRDGALPSVWLDNEMWCRTASTFGDVNEPDYGDIDLDFSAPAERDGWPTRMDALPWGLILLGRHLGMVGPYGIRAISAATPARFVITGSDPQGAPAARVLAPPCDADPDGGPATTIEPWPNLSGLPEADAARAVLVAALRSAQ